jgi:L-ascorbate metabolism protein UlaG (beta-lactamase superfamily)
VFLGDLGHGLTSEEVAPIHGADVLLAAAGGPPTIDFPEIPGLIEAIAPRLILPMHYKTPRINLKIQPVARFLECVPKVPVDRPGEAWIDIRRETLPVSTRIVVLDHAR